MPKILIADDDRAFVEMIRAQLEFGGFETVVAYEGTRTVEVAHHERPDLIILDWKMPSGKGDAVLEFLKERDDTMHIPVMILTGVREPGMEEKARKLGVKAFIRKPYEPEDLLQKIREMLLWRKFEESISRD